MRNAHRRFGILEYTKRMKDTTTQIRLRLDRLVGEVEKDRSRITSFRSWVGTPMSAPFGQPSRRRVSSRSRVQELLL
jgi:hypothetical protein